MKELNATLFRPAKLWCNAKESRRSNIAVMHCTTMQGMQTGNKQLDKSSETRCCNVLLARNWYSSVTNAADISARRSSLSHRLVVRCSLNHHRGVICACQGSLPQDAQRACVWSMHRCARKSSPQRKVRSAPFASERYELCPRDE